MNMCNAMETLGNVL